MVGVKIAHGVRIAASDLVIIQPNRVLTVRRRGERDDPTAHADQAARPVDP